VSIFGLAAVVSLDVKDQLMFGKKTQFAQHFDLVCENSGIAEPE